MTNASTVIGPLLLACSGGNGPPAVLDSATPATATSSVASCGWSPAIPPVCSRAPEIWNPDADQEGVGTCQVNGDCAASEFCGLGSCRSVDDTAITVCLNGASHRGAHHGDANEGPTLHALFTICGDLFWESIFGAYWILQTVEQVGCDVQWDTCRLVNASEMTRTNRTASEYWDDGAHWKGTVYADFQTLGAADIAERINGGCQRYVGTGTMQDLGDAPYETTLWQSMWFP